MPMTHPCSFSLSLSLFFFVRLTCISARCSVVGNPRMCATVSEGDCYGEAQLPLSFDVNITDSKC